MKMSAHLRLLPLLFIAIAANSQVNLTISSEKPKTIQRGFGNPLQPQSANRSPERVEKCGFAYMMGQAKAKGFNEQAYEAFLGKLIQKRKTDAAFRGQAIVTIPVIFHVVYKTGDSDSINVSQARINAQIQQLNEDFGNLSGSAYGSAADMQVRFCAALVDQYGRTLPEPGIDRIDGTLRTWSVTDFMSLNTFVNYCNNVIKPSSIWDPYSYLNVWSVANNSGLLGFATFPGLSTLPGLNNGENDLNAGIVIVPSSVGSKTLNGTEAPYNFGRTLTHEAGHYFGLRHIWGDTNCGDDYCADTPSQDGETIGCPAGPTLTNCNPFENKMFENYMDYSNDACMNTFTANQEQRATTVMANSPRRLSLSASSACAIRAANSIQFPILAHTVTETGVPGNCPSIKTVIINLGIADAATGAATVTFNLAGTASNNADYTISPASVTYTNGDNALKAITITIIDDKAVELAETIQLSYTISGTGVVAGPDRQACTITITDDDIEMIVGNSPVNLVAEDFNGSNDFPTDWVPFTFEGVNQFTVSANGGNGISGNSAHITQDITTRPNTYDSLQLSESILITPLVDATGLSNINLRFNWRCKAEKFNGVRYDYGRIGYIFEDDPDNVFLFNNIFFLDETEMDPDPAAEIFNGILPANFNNRRFWIVFYWFNDEDFGDDPGFTVDDVMIAGQPKSIESTLNDAATTSIFPGQDVQYISTDNQILVRLSGVSQNIGCLTATVQNSGTGTTAINTGTGSFFRSDKVIRLTPASPNTTASYQVTLYYTTAELAVWGGSVSSLKIMKVKDGVNLASLVSSSNSSIATPTVDDQRATKGYAAFTATFTDGFSQFMLVSPATTLPINLLTFEAKAGNRSILLNWSTAQETNNKGFGIERSEDGVTYKHIGWINGSINSTGKSDYNYQDNFVQPGLTYYYRLRQTDLDSREKLSVIRQAKLDKSGLAITLNPNPAKGRVSLFISGNRQLADVSLVNGLGQVVRTWKKLYATDLPAVLDISRLAGGLYLVNIQLPGEKRVEKLLIE